MDRHGPRLDGNAALAFRRRGRPESGREFALRDRAGFESKLIGQRALAVVDVGDDREITNKAWIHKLYILIPKSLASESSRVSPGRGRHSLASGASPLV